MRCVKIRANPTPVEALSGVGQASVGLHAETKTRRGLRGPIEQPSIQEASDRKLPFQLDAVEPLRVVASIFDPANVAG